MPRRVGGEEHHEVAGDRAEPLGARTSRMGEHQPRRILACGHDQAGGERVIEASGTAAAIDAPVEQLGDPLGEHPPAAPDPLAELLRAAPRRHQHEPPGPRIRLHGSEEGGHGIDEKPLRINGLGGMSGHADDLEQRRQGRLLLTLDQREQQPMEVAERVVDDRPGDAGSPGDGLDRDRVEAGLGEDVERGVEQLLAAEFRGESRGARRARTSSRSLAQCDAGCAFRVVM